MLATHCKGNYIMSSSFQQGMVVTIICEAVLQDRLIKLLQTLGASGYTIIPAQGAGSHGKRMGDMAGYNTNIEVKTIVTPETSDQLLEDLKQFQATHALIAFRQNVEGLFD
jgi:nitrogen regulatory protein PII